MSTARNADDLTRDPQDIGKPDPTDSFLDIPTSTTDSKVLRQKGVQDKITELKLENTIRVVIATPGGPEFLAWLIHSVCGGDQPFFNPSNSVMCEVAGRRSVAWQLQSAIRDIDHDLWITVDRAIEQLRPRPKTQKKS